MSVPTISKSILTDRNTVYTEQDVIELVISPEEVPMLNTSQGTYLKILVRNRCRGSRYKLYSST